MNLEFKLKGRDWFGLYMAFLLLYMWPMIGIQFLARGMNTGTVDPANFQVFMMLFAVMMLAMIILVVPLMKKIISGFELDGVPFAYKGDIGEFVLMVIVNMLLCLVTIGIYYAWALRNYMRHIVGRMERNGTRFAFNGTGGRLFLLLLLTLFVPMVLFMVAAGVNAVKLEQNMFVVAVMYIGLYVLMVPYCFYMTKWGIQFSYGDYRINLVAEALPAMVFLLKQLMLTVVTLSIYGPVACAKCYAYFLPRTAITRDGRVTHECAVDFDYMRVWKLAWKWGLLTLVTFGVYGAWAYSNIVKLYMDGTSVMRVADDEVKAEG